MGKGPGAERSCHQKCAVRRRPHSILEFGSDRERKSPPVSQICPGHHKSFEERKELSAVAEVRNPSSISSLLPFIPSSLHQVSPLFTVPLFTIQRHGCARNWYTRGVSETLSVLGTLIELRPAERP